MSYAAAPRLKRKPTRRHEKHALAPLPENVKLINHSGGVDRGSVTIPGPGVAGGAGSVTWLSNKNGGETVVFDKGDGTPFLSDRFTVPDGGNVNSGAATKKGKFRYSVHGAHGNNDPVIVVDP